MTSQVHNVLKDSAFQPKKIWRDTLWESDKKASNPRVDNWGLCCQKQVSQAGISNYIPQFTVGCNSSFLPEIPASDNKVLTCDLCCLAICNISLLRGNSLLKISTWGWPISLGHIKVIPKAIGLILFMYSLLWKMAIILCWYLVCDRQIHWVWYWSIV